MTAVGDPSEWDLSRRVFLKGTGCAALSGAAALTGLSRFFATTALAQPAGADDYKALVCLFLFGGNDANNMIIPVDEYGMYAAVRGSAQFVVPRDQLLAIAPRSDGRKYGLHPNLPKLQGLWNQQRLAAVVNVGTLIEPITRAQYLAGAPRPRQLFSHADQQAQFQTSISAGSARSGWGGRLADRLGDPAGFPTVTSVAGVNIFSAGEQNSPLVISPAPTKLNDALRLTSADPGIQALLDLDRAQGAALVAANSALASQALRQSQALSSDPVLATVFPPTLLGNQLKQVAKLLSLRTGLGVRRQVFFASLGGFDTHTNQLADQGALFTQLDDALAAFYQATVELGVAETVTTFTVSDFARTFQPGGGLTGTDHAWGSHQLVIGGDVRGGDFAGSFPTLALQGPDDTDTGTGARGRWIPTTSVDQYGSTLARWFGVADSDLPLVFPNLDRFATNDLAFLAAAAGSTVTTPPAVLQGTGYWTTAADGGVFAYGRAGFRGSLGATHLSQPVVGMAPTPSGNGYWLVASDGGIFAFGDARFLGSTGGIRLDRPVVGMAPTPSGNGYWLVASDGGIFAFGDARFLGSTGGTSLRSPVVGMATPPSGNGYWLVASDGGVFAFGAPFLGSMGGAPLSASVVGIAPTPAGNGYWLSAADGGIFAFGNAGFSGNVELAGPSARMVAVAAFPGRA